MDGESAGIAIAATPPEEDVAHGLGSRLREAWDVAHAAETMFLACATKYAAHPTCRGALLEAGNVELVGPHSTWQ